ncbi:unnamed protein product [Owenia fusiformis]|uniref:G-protein coupled receptors family 3 profile domain-containing protein n=1 Tax=Owenia fusiformis TaxID=6347 RepID=A0A8S4PJ26_OWEFU|nr:unnamed protein product [Owenia fusiformis]
MERVVMEGDVMLGGLVRIRSLQEGKHCSGKIKYGGNGNVQIAESMQYAIKAINSDNDILPNVTLGCIIVDQCALLTTNVLSVLNFLPLDKEVRGIPEIQNLTSSFYDIAGVVEFATSTNAITTATMFSPFQIPQIDTIATTDELSDTGKYPFLFRVVPPDRYQVKAMVDLLMYYNWTYISVLYWEGNYGNTAFKTLRQKTKERGICIGYSEMVASDTSHDEWEDIVERLIKTKARIVVLFTYTRGIRKLFPLVEAKNKTGEFIWLGADAFDTRTDTSSLRPFRVGSFSFNLPQYHDRQFEKFYRSRNPWNSGDDNPWFPDLWENLFNCQWEDEGKNDSCTNYKDISYATDHPLNMKTSMVIEAVHTLAHALDAMMKEECPNATGDHLRQCVYRGKLLSDYIRNLDFEGPYRQLRFDEFGDIIGSYVIKQYVEDNDGVFETRDVGIWDQKTNRLTMNMPRIQFHERLTQTDTKALVARTQTVSDNLTNETRQEAMIPDSVCSYPCLPGEFYVQLELKCCWECRSCRNNEIVVRESTSCEACPLYTWPEQTNFTTCINIPNEVINYLDPIVITILTIAGMGIAFCVWIAAVYAHHRDKKLIKASNTEISALIMFGTITMYITAFSYCIEPSELTCYWRRLGFSLSFALMYSPLFSKGMRIYRIFRAAEKFKRGTSRLSSTTAMMMLSVILVMVQVALSAVVAWLSPPTMEQRMPIPTEKFVESSCSLPLWTLVAPLGYNLLLIIITAFYGFQTRRLPDNFNESLHIFLCVCATLFLWLAFIPTYFTAMYVYHQNLLFSLVLLLNATVALMCLFLPRVYALYFINESDIKFSSSTTFSFRGESSGATSTSNSTNTSSTSLNKSTEITFESNPMDKKVVKSIPSVAEKV